MKQALGNGWKFLTSKLHKPLPLSVRESQKLLTLLNDSFKRNLDRRYPPGLADSEHSPDDHFKALLKSPLFDSNGIQNSSQSIKRSERRHDAFKVQDMVLSVKEPVEYFRKQVAIGAANMLSAKLALNNQMKKALASPFVDVKDSVRSSEIGSVMVNWLWSSGQYERLDFIRDRGFVARLMPFLVAEAQYKPIWEWLQRARTLSAIRQPTYKAWASPQKDIGFLFKRLIMAEVEYGQGFLSAIQLFLTNHNASKMTPINLPFACVHMHTLPAGAYLVMKLASQEFAAVDGYVVDKFDRSIEAWAPPRFSAPYKALIQLLDPQKAKASPTNQLITALEAKLNKEEHHLAVASVGLMGVEVLLRQGDIRRAAEVMRTLQKVFPTELGELGEKGKSPNPHKEDEEAALRSLDQILAT